MMRGAEGPTNLDGHALTFGDRQKGYERHCVTLCTSGIVVHKAVRHIQWPIVILARGDRDGRLVTTEDDRTECRTVGAGVLCNLVLRSDISDE